RSADVSAQRSHLLIPARHADRRLRWTQPWRLVRHGAVHLPPGGVLALQSLASAAPTPAVVFCTRLSPVPWRDRHRSSAPAAAAHSPVPCADAHVGPARPGEASDLLVPLLRLVRS